MPGRRLCGWHQASAPLSFSHSRRRMLPGSLQKPLVPVTNTLKG
jgi:hypothetical protein